MSTGRSAKYLETKQVLLQRIRNGYSSPGSKFMPIRTVAAEFQVSYPTAQTLVDELVKEGYLERRSTAGTFVPGSIEQYNKVHLVFPSTGRKQSPFGGILLQRLVENLDRDAIPWRLTWEENWRRCADTDYCVLSRLDSVRIVRELTILRRRGLLLNDIPPAGASVNYFDSVTSDAFSCGMLAGKIQKTQSKCIHPAILANPHGRQVWAQQCCSGFRAIWPRARICHPPAWSSNAIQRYFRILFSHQHDGIFCCVKWHALELLKYCEERKIPTPSIVVVAPPPKWPDFPFPQISPSTDDFLDTAIRIIRNRIAGDTSPAAHITLAPRVLADSAWLAPTH